MSPTETLDALAPYNEVRAAIAKLKAENASIVFEYATPKGNKLARSHIHVLRQRKADIERIRKEQKAEALEYGRKVDAAAKEISGEVEAMIEVHQKPLDEIEQREEARKAAHEANLAALAVPQEYIADAASYAVVIDRLKATVIDATWEEYEKPARETLAATLAVLEPRYAALVMSEAAAVELARLKAAQAERDAADAKEREARARAEREAQIAKEAAERANKEAARAAEAERQKAADAADAARREAEAKAAQELAAEREKTRLAQLQAEKARREKAEAEARVAREEAERKAAEDKRKADTAHRERILSEAAKAMADIACAPADGARYVIGRQLADAIAAGKIPHCSITF